MRKIKFKILLFILMIILLLLLVWVLRSSVQDNSLQSSPTTMNHHRQVIEMDKGRPGVIRVSLPLTGKIIFAPNKEAHIHPRFSGVVKEIYKNEGDSVSEGEVLAKVESNVGLKIYPLISKISGIIIKKDLAVGEYVSEEREVFSVADTSALWANLNVRQNDLPLLKNGLEVAVMSLTSTSIVKSVISFISPILDESTRSATVMVPLIFDDGKGPSVFLSGQNVKALVTVSNDKVDLMVKNTSLLFAKTGVMMIVKIGNGFKRIKVLVGRRDFENSEIVHGLSSTDDYVVRAMDE